MTLEIVLEEGCCGRSCWGGVWWSIRLGVVDHVGEGCCGADVVQLIVTLERGAAIMLERGVVELM